VNKRILGAVLAGGRSRRFGSDKALALFQGRPLIAHSIDTLQRRCARVVVCGRESDDLASLADRPRSDMGPLGGLNAALRHALDGGYDGVLTTGCDMPFLPDIMMAELTRDGAAIVRDQHLVGYWPSQLADALDAHLDRSEDRSIRRWIAIIAPRAVDAPDGLLPNINTPADLDRLNAPL
jgi:molybdopterin-guanine dinucleotide biosynthesis protein A